MKQKTIIYLIFAMVLLLTSLVARAAFSVSISPTSGPPGTVVTVTTSPDYGGLTTCYANGAPIGGSGSTYTVPNGVSSVTFYCEAGTGEFYERTNDAVFTVILPDGDGDGVPDGQDQCPNQHAQTPNGCPTPQNNNNPQPNQPNQPNQPGQPSDRDGDGVPDDQDQCPDVHFQSANGCPPDAQPTPIQITLPSLPQDGFCYVATQTATVVNVRSFPSTDADILGTLNPFEVYTSSTRYDDGANIWYLVDSFSGWVAGFVVRQSAPCAELPFGDPLDGFESITLASMSLEDVLAACPELIPQVMELPPFHQLTIIESPTPCDTAAELLRDILWSDYFFRLGDDIHFFLFFEGSAGFMGGFPPILIDLPSLFELSEVGDDGEAEEPLTPEEEEMLRVGRGELTDAEREIANMLESVCGIPWEPDGREIVQFMAAADFPLDEIIATISSDRCGEIRAFAEQLETTDDGLVRFAPRDEEPLEIVEICIEECPDSPEEPRPMHEDPDPEEMLRVWRGELTDDEREMAALLESVCGVPWEPDGREIVQYTAGTGTPMDIVLAMLRSGDIDCSQVILMGHILETNDDGTVFLNVPPREPDDEIIIILDDDDLHERDSGSGSGSDSGSSDAGGSDSGSSDAGGSDSGSSDTGGSDSGSSDTGGSDSGSSDTGGSDSGSSDAGGTTYPAPSVDDILGALGPIPAPQIIVEVSEGDDRHFYRIQDGTATPLPASRFGDIMLPSLSPDGNRLLFLQDNGAGQLLLYFVNLEGDATPQPFDFGGRLLPYRGAWLPNGDVLITLLDENNTPAIYQLNLTDGSLNLLLENAAAPTVDMTGRIMAFERPLNGVLNIHFKGLDGGTVQFLTEAETGGCVAPMFAPDDLALYYVCDGTLYRYGTDGPQALVDGVQQYLPVAYQLVMYSDGQSVFLLDESTMQSRLLVNSENVFSAYWQ